MSKMTSSLVTSKQEVYSLSGGSVENVRRSGRMNGRHPHSVASVTHLSVALSAQTSSPAFAMMRQGSDNAHNDGAQAYIQAQLKNTSCITYNILLVALCTPEDKSCIVSPASVSTVSCAAGAVVW